MVSLPELEDYSLEQIRSFHERSTLFQRYTKIINEPVEEYIDKIRQLRHRHWLKCAYATIQGESSPEDICHYWSLASEEILKKTWEHCELHKEPLSLFAFGKLGSKELNLSSDIDIIFLKNSQIEASEQLSRSVKKFISILGEVRKTGFVFRVDTSLRPGGPSSPLLPNEEQFLNFYMDFREAWHRISFIRLRPLFGDSEFNKNIMRFTKSLSFPKRLDYSVINNVKGLRSKLKVQHRDNSEIIDIKFQSGGIRDIELYIQSLQVIYGGHRSSLQTPSITHAMENLFKEGILEKDSYDFFSNFYWKLRDIENHIQCSQDQHTYKLTEQIYPLFSKKLDKQLLLSELNKSQERISFFFDEPEQKEALQGPDNLNEISKKAIEDIKSLKGHALKKNEVETQKNQILENFVTIITKIDIDQNLAMQSFKDFIFSIKSKSSIFYLLNRQEVLLEHLAWLFSFSPYISNILCRRPELLDSYVLGAVDIKKDGGTEALLEDLNDYKLLGQMISIGHFLKNQNISSFCDHLSDNADYIASQLLEHFVTETKSSSLDILCMGKWSGRELGIQSDLDFVFLSENPPKEKEIKAAKRFISAMTTPTRTGKLYNIDLRLKPNQHAGPLLLQKTDLKDFLQSKALGWQKQAYLKSRLLSDNSMFYKNIFPSLEITPKELSELVLIQRKLLVKPHDKLIDLKYVHGGLVHTEFSIQTKILSEKINIDSCDTESMHQALSWPTKIMENYHFLRKFEQLFQICIGSSSTKVSENHTAMLRLSKAMRIEQPFLELKRVCKEQDELLKSLDRNH